MNSLFGVIREFNALLEEHLDDVPLLIEDEHEDYSTMKEYVRVSWHEASYQPSRRATRKSALCHVEVFSQLDNIYAHVFLAERVLEFINAPKRVWSKTVDVVNVRTNFLNLDGARKVDIRFEIRLTE